MRSTWWIVSTLTDPAMGHGKSIHCDVAWPITISECHLEDSSEVTSAHLINVNRQFLDQIIRAARPKKRRSAAPNFRISKSNLIN
jgi:hypothetical protein